MKNVFDWLFEESKETFASWAIVELMSRQGMENFGEFDSSNIIVEMKINGVHVDFEALCKEMDNQLSDLRLRVKKEVESEIRSDTIYQVRDCLDNMEDES